MLLTTICSLGVALILHPKDQSNQVKTHFTTDTSLHYSLLFFGRQSTKTLMWLTAIIFFVMVKSLPEDTKRLY